LSLFDRHNEALPVEDRSLTGFLTKPFDLIRPTLTTGENQTEAHNGQAKQGRKENEVYTYDSFLTFEKQRRAEGIFEITAFYSSYS